MKKANNKKINNDKVLQAVGNLAGKVNTLTGTVDNLAVMTKKGFDNAVSKEEFNSRFSRHERAIETILSEIRNLREDNKQTLSVLKSFVSDVSTHDRKIENLTVRTEKLEQKVRQ